MVDHVLELLKPVSSTKNYKNDEIIMEFKLSIV